MTQQLHSPLWLPTHTGRATMPASGWLPPLLGLLTAAALVDWLITRTLTRLAIFIPKTEAMVAGYVALGWVGQLGSTLAALLALAGMAWIVRAEWQRARSAGLWLLIAAQLALSAVFLVQPPGDWLLLYHALSIACLITIGLRTRRQRPTARLAVGIAVAAMLAAALHQAAPTLYTVLRWAGPPPWGRTAFLAGEILVIVAAATLWWAYGRRAARSAWLLATLPALLFAASYLATPAMTATIVIWSNGLTLFLPWWLYAAALWLLCVTVLHRFQRGDHATAAALLLLASAGYAPQLSSQFYLGVIAVWLLQFSALDPYKTTSKT